MKKIALIFLTIFLVKNSLASCEDKSELNLFYINGIAVAETQATEEYDSIIKLLVDKNTTSSFTVNPDKICTILIYNQTNGRYTDLIESAAQIMESVQIEDAVNFDDDTLSKFIFKRDLVLSLGDLAIPTPSKKLSALIKLYKLVKDSELTANADIVQRSHVETAATTLKQLEEVSLNNNPGIIISHSQGSLFANEVYEIAKRIEIDSLRTNLDHKFANLQIGTFAEQTSFPISDYYTYFNDPQVESLQAIGAGEFNPLQSNFRYFPGASTKHNISYVSFFYSSLIETYLDENGYGSFKESTFEVEHPWRQGLPETDFNTPPFYYVLHNDKFIENGEVKELAGDNRFIPMRDIFYKKLNALAKKVTSQTTPDCNGDRINGDYAIINESGGIISFDSKVIDGAIIENGARVCNKTIIEEPNTYLSGNRVVIDGLKIGDQCNFVGITAEGDLTWDDVSKKNTNKLDIYQGSICDRSPASQVVYNSIDPSSEMNIHRTLVDGTAYIEDASMYDSSLTGGAGTVLNTSTVVNTHIYGSTYIYDSEIGNYNLQSTLQRFPILNGDDAVLSIQGAFIYSSTGQKTMSGLCLIQGQAFDTNITCADPYPSLHPQGYAIVFHLSFDGLIYGTSSSVSGRMFINGVVEDSQLTGTSFHDFTTNPWTEYFITIKTGAKVKNVNASGYFEVTGNLENTILFNQVARNGVITPYKF